MKPRPNRPSTSHRSRWPCVALAASCWISPRRNFVVSWQGGRVESFTTSVGKIYGKIVVQCCPSVPMLHMLPVDSSMFKWLLMDVWWLVISDDFWWFQRDLPVTWGRTTKILTSELEGLPSEERTGTRWGTTCFWAKVGVYSYINQFGWFRIQHDSTNIHQYPMISELWLTTWCRIWCESVDMIYIYDISFYISCYIYKWYFSWCFSRPPRT